MLSILAILWTCPWKSNSSKVVQMTDWVGQTPAVGFNNLSGVAHSHRILYAYHKGNYEKLVECKAVERTSRSLPWIGKDKLTHSQDNSGKQRQPYWNISMCRQLETCFPTHYIKSSQQLSSEHRNLNREAVESLQKNSKGAFYCQIK